MRNRYLCQAGQLAIAVTALFLCQLTEAQQQPSELQQKKTELEIRKLELEVERLESWRARFSDLAWLLTGALTTAAGFYAARRTRQGALDQAVHEQRLECYPKLVQATSSLAAYFPGASPAGRASIGPDEAGNIGTEMRKWYFDAGGLLLSIEGRNAYFRLARALTLAASEAALAAPRFPEDARHISNRMLDDYCDELKIQEISFENIEKWKFGPPASNAEQAEVPLHVRFKDYVFLQTLSSRLRRTLSDDLRSRRRPR